VRFVVYALIAVLVAAAALRPRRRATKMAQTVHPASLDAV
jgi:hypothetical protein